MPKHYKEMMDELINKIDEDAPANAVGDGSNVALPPKHEPGVKKNKRRIFIGLDSKLLELSQRIFPNKYHRLWPFFMLPLSIFRDKKPINALD